MKRKTRKRLQDARREEQEKIYTNKGGSDSQTIGEPTLPNMELDLDSEFGYHPTSNVSGPSGQGRGRGGNTQSQLSYQGGQPSLQHYQYQQRYDNYQQSNVGSDSERGYNHRE